MYTNILGRFTQPAWGRIRFLAGVLLLLSATPASAAPLEPTGC